MKQNAQKIYPVGELDVTLERDGFCRTILRELSGLLQEMIGLEEAEGYISVVGQNIGSAIDADYKSAMGVNKLNRQQIAEVLVDLKARIKGQFYIVEQDNNKIVLGNTVCPFEDKVLGRDSLCMMTSNVFGTVTAENAGFAKVCLHETIAKGDNGCKVVVYLRQTPEADKEEGNEYYRS